MADKRISQLVERTDIANNDVLPIVASGATTTNKVTVSTLQEWMQDNLDVGVTSVGLSMPSAFVVSASPVTTSGNIAVTGAGTVSQYIRGDGSLADFPQSSGGGGASVSYYLNGSVSQGTIGGIAYREMNKTPIFGTGTDITINANGYIASFITDAGDPALLEIPGGNWNFETYLSASSGGGSPTFYIELYKVNSGGTATLIASNSTTPESISLGTNINPYFSALAVPTTTLSLTDRLALRYYVTHAGRTITLHTENSHLCQIITTFTTGLTALNGLTAQVQNFATGTSGTDFAISSSSATHTFNLPTASATNRGALSSTDWSTFNAKQPAGNYVTTDTTQSITGEKTFSGSSLRLAANGTADAVVLRNVSGTTGSDSGATTIGFNGSDNLFISTQSKGGFIIGFNNSVSNREYTLPDTSGTFALGTGGQGRVAYWNNANTLTSDSLFQWNDFSKRLGIGRTPTVSLDVEGAGYFSGALGVGGALNGTSASFSGNGLFGGSSAVSGLAGGISVNGSTNSGINFRIADALRGYAYVAANGSMNFESTSGNIVLSPNGSPALTMAASTGAATFSSSVGVGLSGTPAKTLEVRGTLAISNSSSSYWYMDRDDSDGRFKILTDTDNERFSIATGGAATFSSSVTAGGAGSIKPQFIAYGGASLGAGMSFLTDLSETGRRNWGIFTEDQVIGDFVIKSSTAAGGNPQSGNTRLAILNSGNVGIGTASPTTKFVVSNAGAGGIEMQGNSSVSGGAFLQTYNRSTNAFIDLDIVANNTIFRTGQSYAEAMRITSGGALKASNTGNYLGATSAYHELRQGAAETNIAILTNTTSTPYGLNIYYPSASPNSTNYEFIYCNDSTQSKFIVWSNGSVVNRTGSYGAISDAKVKENIEDATPKLDDLMKVKVRKYNLIGDDKKQIGVIAQELEEVFPAMIDESEDFEEVEVPQVDEEGNEVLNEEGEVVTENKRVSKGTTTKSVKYSVFVPMLIKAMQEQQEQIKSLTEQVEALKSQING